MRTIAHHTEALALAQNQAQDQARQARGDVHNIAAGEVKRADGVADQAAVAAPHHMSQRRIHHDGPNGHERAHSAELHTAGKRAGDDGGGDHAERHLEHEVDDGRVNRVFGNCFRLSKHIAGAVQEAKLIKAPEKGDRTVSAVRERPTADCPSNGNNADGAKHHDHRVHHVLAARQAAVEERESGRHQQDEHGAHKHERR